MLTGKASNFQLSVGYCLTVQVLWLNNWNFCRDGSARITYELITDCSQRNMASSSASVVTVNRIGQVSTASLSGTAVVLVTVHEEFGINQTVVVHVEVTMTDSYSNSPILDFDSNSPILDSNFPSLILILPSLFLILISPSWSGVMPHSSDGYTVNKFYPLDEDLVTP